MEISSIPNYLVYSIKRLPTPKVNKLQSPKLRLTQSILVATLTQNFMQFRCTVMEISSIPNYLVYSIKRLPTPKVNKLQSPKLRLTQSLLVATFTQNFMRFRCTVMEKRHQNFPPHNRLIHVRTVSLCVFCCSLKQVCTATVQFRRWSGMLLPVAMRLLPPPPGSGTERGAMRRWSSSQATPTQSWAAKVRVFSALITTHWKVL